MKKLTLLLALLPILAYGEYNGIYDDDMFYCAKGCRLSRVWGTDWVGQGRILRIVSCPWTAGGTFLGQILSWDGKYPMVLNRNLIVLHVSWYYERTGPVSRSQGCHYRYLSNFLKDPNEWIYPVPGF